MQPSCVETTDQLPAYDQAYVYMSIYISNAWFGTFLAASWHVLTRSRRVPCLSSQIAQCQVANYPQRCYTQKQKIVCSTSHLYGLAGEAFLFPRIWWVQPMRKAFNSPEYGGGMVEDVLNILTGDLLFVFGTFMS